jgi:hypothetical protein
MYGVVIMQHGTMVKVDSKHGMLFVHHAVMVKGEEEPECTEGYTPKHTSPHRTQVQITVCLYE